MSGIDSGRVAPPTAITQKIANAIYPARPKPDNGPASHAPSTTRPEGIARTAGTRGTTTFPTTIGFLAQAIAQESLLLGARASQPHQKDPVALYRQTQGSTSPAPGPQISIDIKI